MILTDEQKSNISVLVSNEVKYHETYQEVYDHMVTTLEVSDYLPDLKKSYADTLEQDFGGHRGIEKLEANRRWLIWKETSHTQKQIFNSFFKWPGVLIPLSVAIFYYLGINDKHFRLWLFAGSIIMIVFPFFLMGIGNFIIKLKTGKKRKSINNISINSMARRMCQFYIVGFVYGLVTSIWSPTIYLKTNHTFSIILGDIIMGGVFVLSLLYAVCVFMVYRIEFKKRLTT